MARNENGKRFSLKDHLFNKKKVEWLASQFKNSDKNFNDKEFVAEVMKSLKKLELKQRIVLIAEVLEKHLDSDFKIAATQIVKALPPALDPTKTDDDFGDFMIAPLGEYVVRNGLSKKHLKTSLKTLRELTKRFSMEDAIRYFINEFPEETMTELEKWTKDKNYHVRRLVSEGTRPLLPWSGRVCISDTDPLPFLNILYADKTRYVTRSVANHMNDISKSNPSLVVNTLKNWKKLKQQDDKELDWIIRHSLRTVVKRGDKDALELLGYHSDPKIKVSDITLSTKRLKRGGAIEFSFLVKAKAAEKLMVDYVVDFVKANGETKPKVHKLKQISLEANEEVKITKKHKFPADATTFTLYPGKHSISLQINGGQYPKSDFELI